MKGKRNHMKRMRGNGVFEDFGQFTQNLGKKPISTIAKLALPALGGGLGSALGGAVGTIAIPGVGSIGGGLAGGVLGDAVGKKAADWLESKGYGRGRRKMMMSGRGMTLGQNGLVQMSGKGRQSGRGTTPLSYVTPAFGRIYA